MKTELIDTLAHETLQKKRKGMIKRAETALFIAATIILTTVMNAAHAATTPTCVEEWPLIDFMNNWAGVFPLFCTTETVEMRHKGQFTVRAIATIRIGEQARPVLIPFIFKVESYVGNFRYQKTYEQRVTNQMTEFSTKMWWKSTRPRVWPRGGVRATITTSSSEITTILEQNVDMNENREDYRVRVEIDITKH